MERFYKKDIETLRADGTIHVAKDVLHFHKKEVNFEIDDLATEKHKTDYPWALQEFLTAEETQKEVVESNIEASSLSAGSIEEASKKVKKVKA
jgi:hypothetical protein